MSEENALVNVLDNLPTCEYADNKTFEAMSTSGNFLPYLSIMTGSSTLVQEGKIQVGRIALIKNKNTFVDLGPSANIFVLGWRPKAMEINPDNIKVAYAPKDPEFKRIEAKAEIPQSKAFFGPEFLIYLESEKCFCTYHMSSKTSKREAGNVAGMARRWATLGVQMIKDKGNTWHGPTVKICNTNYELPPGEEILEKVLRFNKPPVTEVEAAPEDSGRDR